MLEHPLFAAQNANDRALVFFGSQRLSLFQLLEVSFAVQTTPVVGSDGKHRDRAAPPPHADLRVTKAFPMTQDISLDNARVVLGTNLNPVAYRVGDGIVEYVTYGDQGWSPRRTLAVANGLTLDQAIPLVENLAR